MVCLGLSPTPHKCRREFMEREDSCIQDLTHSLPTGTHRDIQRPVLSRGGVKLE